jgi:Ca2+-binding EF-hand superfamily protein
MRSKLILVFGLIGLLVLPLEGLTQFPDAGGSGKNWPGGGGGKRWGGNGGKRGTGGPGGGWRGRDPGGANAAGMPASTGAVAPATANRGGRRNNPDAWSNWAQSMFLQLDQNGDGYLNNDEMPEALRAERDKWDSDKNGLIDLNEFTAYFQARVQQSMAERNALRGQGGSGMPDLEPVAAAVEAESRPVVYRTGKLPKELPPWFQQLDTDHDAQIGLYEWRASGRSIEEFEQIDRNKDGFLTVEEVLHYTASQGKNGSRPVAFGPGMSGDRTSLANGPRGNRPSRGNGGS